MVVEKLHPGPLNSILLPSFKGPLTTPLARDDKMVLSLYYRWALQTLSAFTFLHSRKIFLQEFSDTLVWLRSDLSIAVTGFISANIDGKLEDYGEEGGWAGDEFFYYTMGKESSVQRDLWYWAMFVWRLMTTGPKIEGESWDPTCPEDGGVDASPEMEHALRENSGKGLYQELEDERLGPVFIKAWNSQYANADEARDDVLFYAKKAGIEVTGDEINIGESWEEIFEVAATDREPWRRELKLKHKM